MAEVGTGEGWLTVRQAAGYLGVSEPTIFRWMRDGTLSYFKLGGATRFRRENLDMVARKVTSAKEGEHHAARCPVCGHGFLLAGQVRSTGRLYFQPEHTKFLVMRDSMIRLHAMACPACGHVQMFTDAEQLARLMTSEDALLSEHADDGAGEETA